MFESPKKHFRALVYLHRYTKDTVNTLLNGYLREFHHKLTPASTDLQHASPAPPPEPRHRPRTEVPRQNQSRPQRRRGLRTRTPPPPRPASASTIDLDDGVKVNYLKFGKALATIPGLAAKEK
jgi:hypothetical protein